jgi:nitroreductase
MQLAQILDQRKSCRAFLDRPVDPQLLRSIITKAARAPSNGNLQPWQIYIVTGAALASLKQATKQLVDDQVPLQTPEYQVYPKPLKDMYDQRRQEIGEDLYRVLGIPREDKQKRRGQFAKNALMFNAPVGVFAYIDRSLSYGQWMDLGMYLQSVMLLCEGHGLATCAQGYWTFFHETVRQTTGASDDLMLACGIAIGFEDQNAPINKVRSSRVAVEDFAIFIDR